MEGRGLSQPEEREPRAREQGENGRRKRMPPENCEAIVEVIERLTQALADLDRRLDSLVEAGQEQLNPLRYFSLQPEADRLLVEKNSLQDRWSRTMNDLATCRSNLARSAVHLQ
jgi:hypothetical protein